MYCLKKKATLVVRLLKVDQCFIFGHSPQEMHYVGLWCHPFDSSLESNVACRATEDLSQANYFRCHRYKLEKQKP